MKCTRSLVAFACLAASSTCFAVDTALDDCKKKPVPAKVAILKKIVKPPMPAASVPKVVKKKHKVLPPVPEIDCPPLKPAVPYTMIPPPDEVTLPPESPLMPVPVPAPLTLALYPLGPECFCEIEGGGGYAPVAWIGGGGGGYFTPQTPALPPIPEPHEWLIIIAGLACIGARRGRT